MSNMTGKEFEVLRIGHQCQVLTCMIKLTPLGFGEDTTVSLSRMSPAQLGVRVFLGAGASRVDFSMSS